jgi:hypothetical protein
MKAYMLILLALIPHDFSRSQKETANLILGDPSALDEGASVSLPLPFSDRTRHRICPGRHLAHGSLWIAIASTLATMTISKKHDASGKEITPKVAFTSGITRCLLFTSTQIETHSTSSISHPHPYQCSIQPRTNTARDLIAQSEAWGTD